MAVQSIDNPSAALSKPSTDELPNRSIIARLYGVATSNLNKAVKRNINRFPGDFIFQLTVEEATALRFQNGISKAAGRGGRRYLPYVFTEQGVAMLSSVLRSRRAVEVNIEIMRAVHP